MRIGLWLTVAIAAAVLLWNLPRGAEDMAYGQDAAPAAPAIPAAEDADATIAEPPAEADPEDAAAAAKNAADQPLGKLVMNSGVFGIIFYLILGVFSVAATAVAFERLFRLTRQKVVPPALVAGLQNLVREKNDTIDNFRTLCHASPSPAARVLQAGIARAGRPLPEVEKAMEDAIAREAASQRSRSRPLDEIGSVAPLVGLLGTVVGMIFAFRISSQAGLGRAELLAEGIYLALMTTAAGLTIAIPCMLLYAWFNTRADRYLREIDEALLDAMPCFTRLENNAKDGGLRIEESTAAASATPMAVAAGSSS
jgi:biopolymer transport protein ExbB